MRLREFLRMLHLAQRWALAHHARWLFLPKALAFSTSCGTHIARWLEGGASFNNATLAQRQSLRNPRRSLSRSVPRPHTSSVSTRRTSSQRKKSTLWKNVMSGCDSAREFYVEPIGSWGRSSILAPFLGGIAKCLVHNISKGKWMNFLSVSLGDNRMLPIGATAYTRSCLRSTKQSKSLLRRSSLFVRWRKRSVSC